MSVRLYDEALLKKFKSWIKDDKLRILSPDDSTRLFQQRLDMQDDKPLSLPLIALSRDPQIELEYPHKKPMTYDGIMLRATEEKSLQLDAIPMTLNYQLDIYTRYSKEADEYMRNFVFNMVNHPVIAVEIPYNGIDYIHYGNMELLSTIEDNSDIPQRLFYDQFVRWTLKFTIRDAYLFSLPYKDNIQIGEYEVKVVENL